MRPENKMNYKRTLIQLVLIAMTTLSTCLAWAISCEDLFTGDNKQVISEGVFQSTTSRSIIEEQQELRRQFDSLSRGVIAPSAIPATPANREVTMYVSSEKSTSLYEGRIVGVQSGANGQSEVLLLRKDYNNNYVKPAEAVPLSKIDLKSIGIRKVVSIEEQQVTVARFQAALQAGDHVSYVSQFGGLREEKGRIASIERDQNGIVTSFVLAEDNGSEFMHSIGSVDPVSIKTFKAQPRQLTSAEAILVAELKAAISDRKYVSFRAKSGSKVGQYEGWVTEVEVGTNGEYLFRVNENKCELGCGSHKYKLSDILLESFDSRPSLMVREAGDILNGGRAAAQVIGYFENSQSGSKKSVSVTQSLYSELSVFADSKQASGSRLPYELENLVSPGSELRLYFSSGERSIRLTVRRDASGNWSFGDTAFDRLAVSESYVDIYSKSRYTISERDRLDGSNFEGRLPAARLRNHLSMIRDTLMKGQVELEFQVVQKEWSKSIPEDVDRAEVVELLLHDQGQRFYLNRGFVRENQTSLTEAQTKKLAAVKYLIRNNLIFYSGNAGASGIKMGIYPQGSLEPTSMWLTGYDFGRQLFESMDAAGLQYTNGEWGSK